MITLHDIVHLPDVEPWLERIAAAPRGLVVVAGLGGDGPSGVLGILCRQMLDVPGPNGARRRALAIGTQRRFVRAAPAQAAQVTSLLVEPGVLSYEEALAQAADRPPDLAVLDELSAANVAAVLRLAAHAIVLAPLDSLLVGGGVLRHVADLGVAEEALAQVSWVVSVQRLAALCRHCAEPCEPTPDERRALGPGSFYRNRGCPACAGAAAGHFVTAFDIFQHRPEEGPPAAQARRASDLPLRAYAAGLARLGLISLQEAYDLEFNSLRRAQKALLERQGELGRTASELRAKAATLEASERALLARTQAMISLQDVTQTLAASTGLDDLAGRILHYANHALGADLVTLCLIEPDGSGRVAALSGWNAQALGRSLPSEETARWLGRAAEGRPLGGGEVPSALRGLPLNGEGARGGLLLALAAHCRPVGLLFAHSSLKRRFAQSERGVLQMFADQAAVAIQRARLIADLQAKIVALKAAQVEIVKKERMEHELRLARELQQSMLPAELPHPPNLQLDAESVPAREVGGDFYDAFELRGRRIGLVIADVSDKGLPAALFMALTRSLVRAEALRETSPAQVLANVNRLLMEVSHSDMFVTAFYGVLHLERGELVYARAGHERPLHYRPADGRCTALPGGGIALAILPEIALEERTLTLAPGDELLLFTDGVTDAPLASGELYGHDRLSRALAAHYDRGMAGQCRALLADLAALQQGSEPFDDAALLLARYQDGGN